eukprot:scaffold2255_cov55-Phaeocystis_antarctica.AAC.2
MTHPSPAARHARLDAGPGLCARGANHHAQGRGGGASGGSARRSASSFGSSGESATCPSPRLREAVVVLGFWCGGGGGGGGGGLAMRRRFVHGGETFGDVLLFDICENVARARCGGAQNLARPSCMRGRRALSELSVPQAWRRDRPWGGPCIYLYLSIYLSGAARALESVQDESEAE